MTILIFFTNIMEKRELHALLSHEFISTKCQDKVTQLTTVLVCGESFAQPTHSKIR